VRLIWTNSWFSPDKETQAAQSLHTAGSDVLGQNVDSPAAGQYAEKEGIPWVGYDSDARKFAPKQWLTAAVYDWGKYYVRRVKAAINGSWAENYGLGGVANGSNIVLKHDGGPVTFRYDPASHLLSTR